jgi:hypothetical protein
MSKTTYEELEQERDESVAHCEVLNSALIQALAFIERETCDIEDEQQQKRIQDAVHNYKKVLEQTPTQSLLRHDADVIDKFLNKVDEELGYYYRIMDFGCDYIDQLTLQAKEGVK